MALTALITVVIKSKSNSKRKINVCARACLFSAVRFPKELLHSAGLVPLVQCLTHETPGHTHTQTIEI